MKGMISAALIAGAIATTPAGAATIIATGSYQADVTAGTSGALTLGPGRYRFLLTLTSGATYVDSYVEKLSNTNFYCDFQDGAGEVYCGGDDVPTDVAFAAVSPTQYGATVTVLPPRTTLNPGDLFVRTEDFDSCCTYRLDFEAPVDGRYTLSFAAVPEPASWALMIAGFGAVGYALRRRRATVRFATA